MLNLTQHLLEHFMSGGRSICINSSRATNVAKGAAQAERELCASLGAGIRNIRRDRKLSQLKVAQACGIARRTLARLEEGDPGVAVGIVLGVIRFLEISHDAQVLISDEDQGNCQ